MDFYKFINSKSYQFFKKTGDLIIINMLFVLVSILSFGILLIPGIFTLSNITFKMHHTFINPFSEFYLGLKRNLKKYKFLIIWMYGLIIIGYFMFKTYQFLITNELILSITYLSIFILIAIILAIIAIFMNLLIYDNYFEQKESLILKIRKSALISRKKPINTLMMFIVLIFTIFIMITFKITIIIITFALSIYILNSVSAKTYENIYMEEIKRISEE